jgi:hypothetical protein
MNSDLVDLIRRLAPTGTGGFERLVADLLEALTGRHFRLARAGSQAGRDMSLHEANANIVAVECKRYGEDTELNERELQGELAQAAASMPGLDLWVLVTSRDVPSQLYAALHEQARRENLEFLSVSLGDGEPSSLEALCAQSPETVIDYLESDISEDQRRSLEQILEEVAAHPQFAATVDHLREQFLSPLIGYDNWCLAQNQWLDTCLASEQECRANFNQPLNVRETDAMLVPRESAWARLDEWFSNWMDSHEMFVMLGEEGDGKTWAVASWLDRNIQKESDFPAVVFLSSTGVDSSEPSELLSSSTQRRLRTLRIERWAQRIARWTDEPTSYVPRVLLVLDGINERGGPTRWRQLMERLAGSPWRGSVAVLITCRTAYWERYFGPVRYLEAATYVLPPYDDDELDTALAYHDLTRSDVPDELLPLIRKPRYFDLMVRHREDMAKSGDVTVARLIYEDWRDRLWRKGIELDDEGFRSLLKELASAYLGGQHELKERELDDLLPSYYDKLAIIEELRSGGILDGDEGHLRVDEDRLVHGFGLLLVDQIRKAATTSDSHWGEVIAEWLEPQAEMDIKARICEFAALHALSQPDLPQEAKVALLETWVSSHNPGEGAAENLIAYLPLDPSCYTQLAEVVWADATENPWAQELLMQAFLHWYTVPEVIFHLESAFERWLGFVHLYGVSHQRGESQEETERLREEICERVGSDLEPGAFEFAGRLLTAIEDDGVLRLGRAALVVISHIPRGPFVRAIATGCLAEAVMGFPAKYDFFKWVLSTAPQSVWAEVKQEVDRLLDSGHLVAKQAAHRLLSFEGSKEASELQTDFPDNLFPPSLLHIAYEKDPCNLVFALTQETYEACLEREDLSPRHIALHSRHHSLNPNLSVPRGLGTRLAPLTDEVDLDAIWSLMGPTSDDVTFDQHEPALCAFAPEAVAALVRNIVRRADKREGMALRQLAWRLMEHHLILEKEEVDSIYRAWRSLYEEAAAWSNTQREAEMFLFISVLKGLGPQEQLVHLLERPPEAPDLRRYARSLLPVTDLEAVRDELHSPENTERIRRVLWFLRAHPSAMPDDFIAEEVAPFLDHPDGSIRSSVLKIAYVAKNGEIISAFLDSGWAWSNSFGDLENHWGNLLLCEHGGSLTYSELRNRVDPSYLGYAVNCRGLRDGEVNQYAEDIDHIWSRIGSGIPDLPVDFPSIDLESSDDVRSPARRSLSSGVLSRSVTFLSRASTWGGVSEGDAKELFQGWEAIDEERVKLAEIARQAIEEQVEAGNAWFAQDFSAQALERVIEMRPDLVHKGVDYALADSRDGIRRIRLARSFYTQLCAMLLKHEPATGTSLYERLVEVDGGVTVVARNSRIPLLDYALFEAPDVDDLRPVWARRLEQCTTDEELMRVAIVAQTGNGQDWLQTYTDERLVDSAPLETSRAYTLLGFIDTQEAFDHLSQLVETEPDTWRGELVKTSLKRWRMNAWAKHWFERFLTVEDDVMAWAAFRLFLRCVDSRFWLWQEEARAEAQGSPQLAKRIAFLADNSDTIRNRIRKNEKDLRNHLFGQKTKPGQAWPWM